MPILALLVLFALPARSAVLTTCDEASLRAAASNGGVVTFACDGTIVLTDTIVISNSLALDGGGRQVSISGNDRVRLFQVRSGVDFKVTGVRIQNGRTNVGAAIYNDGGNVLLAACNLENHRAIGLTGIGLIGDPASGGAIFNRTGTVGMVSCTFSNNQARGGRGRTIDFLGYCGGPAWGGAIFNESGYVGLTNCQFVMNASVGGQGGDHMFSFGGCGGSASGGTLYSTGGVVFAVGSIFVSNRVEGGNSGVGQNQNGGLGGAASGGACAVQNGAFDARHCEFRANVAQGGGGGRTSAGGLARGGGILCENGRADLSDCRLFNNNAGGGFSWQDNGPSADGNGGAIFNGGALILMRAVFSANLASGSGGSIRPNAGSAGAGSGGGIYNAGDLTIGQSTFAFNEAIGGAGRVKEGFGTVTFSAGGDGKGGAICNINMLRMTNTTLGLNQAIAGARGVSVFPPAEGPAGLAFGSALFNPGSAELLNTTIASNSGPAATLDGDGPIILQNSILAGSAGTPNCGAQIIDNGHNISSDASCSFTNTSSLNGIDPRLGPLTDNGGPTPTMGLLAGSPAIDQGDDSACPLIDQRGVTRPQGSHCDIGAFEVRRDELPPVVRIELAPPASLNIHLRGWPGTAYRLLLSSNLYQWSSVVTNVADAGGRAVFTLPRPATDEFYHAAALE